MLVLYPNITNSWNRQITTRFFYIYPALNLQRTLSHLNEQSRELLLILMIYFRLYFWFLRLSVTPPSHSCVSGQWGGAAGAEKKGREAAGSRLWTPWTREEMINNNNINITNITSQLRPDRCSSSHVILWVQTDRTCFFFYPLFFTSCWEVSLCCFFFFFWRSCRWSLFSAWLHQNKTCWVSCVAPTRPHRERGRGCGGNHGDPG